MLNLRKGLLKSLLIYSFFVFPLSLSSSLSIYCSRVLLCLRRISVSGIADIPDIPELPDTDIDWIEDRGISLTGNSQVSRHLRYVLECSVLDFGIEGIFWNIRC